MTDLFQKANYFLDDLVRRLIDSKYINKKFEELKLTLKKTIFTKEPTVK
jgi:hypothetical protein